MRIFLSRASEGLTRLDPSPPSARFASPLREASLAKNASGSIGKGTSTLLPGYRALAKSTARSMLSAVIGTLERAPLSYLLALPCIRVDLLLRRGTEGK